MKQRIWKLEAALEQLLKALDGYQRHGDMLSDKYKNALFDAKIDAMQALAKKDGALK